MKTAFLLLTPAILAGILFAADPSPLPAPPSVTATANTTEPTEITSEKLQVDYLRNLGTFEGNVLVTDPRISLRADKMVVFFTAKDTNTTAKVKTKATNDVAAVIAKGTNTNNRAIEKIFADGGVVITQENKKANSEHAEYWAEEGKVVLSGNPKVQNPEGTITGKRITFWRGSQRMEVESDPAETNRTRLVIFPEATRKENTEPAPAVKSP